MLDTSSTFYSLVLIFFWQKNIGTKAACKILLKLTNGFNFINILHGCFSYQSAFFRQNLTREKLCEALLYANAARKMLMKLTTGLFALSPMQNSS